MQIQEIRTQIHQKKLIGKIVYCLQFNYVEIQGELIEMSYSPELPYIIIRQPIRYGKHNYKDARVYLKNIKQVIEL